jgi:integrase
MTVRFVEQRDARYDLVRRFWLVDVEVLGIDGRRRRARRVSPTPTRRGAEELERRLRAELVHPKEEVPTFGEFIGRRWWPTYPSSAGNRPATLREKDIHLRVHLLPAFGGLPLDRVGGEVVDRFVASLYKAGKTPKTIANILTTLRTALGSAVRWGLLGAVPLLPRVRVPEASFNFYTPNEAAQLVAAAPAPLDRALLLFALATGARAGEQLAVRWADLEGDAVVFRRSITRGIEGSTKSGRSRAVPISHALRDTLLGLTSVSSQSIFADPQGQPLELRDLHRALSRAAGIAGLARLRWHDLRHSFASACVLGSVPLRQVQLWLGHHSIALTERYSHLAPVAVRPAREVALAPPTPRVLLPEEALPCLAAGA